MKKSSSTGWQSSHTADQLSPTNDAKSKIARILIYLLNGGSLHRFEAERLGEHCLNSTISTLANRYGLNFHRASESVQNKWGAPCYVTR